MQSLQEKGYAIIDQVFTSEEITRMTDRLANMDAARPAFRKTDDLFAVRRFLQEVPEMPDLVFTPRLNTLINTHFGEGYFPVKSIYFDKPEKSNWFVAWHQDLTISVDKRMEMPGFGPWTVKQNQFAVQPPLDVLENIFTIRIHLDDTDEYNGALKVIPGSHAKGIYRPETIDWTKETEVFCRVPAGGVMIMRPLLLHSSNRTINNHKRRVIHIEFSNRALPEGLQWAEKMLY